MGSIHLGVDPVVEPELMAEGASDLETHADRRIAAESLVLRRSPLDPVRAVAAAETAGLRATPAEREILGALLERLEDAGAVTLGGPAEGRARLAALAVADAFLAGASRVLWIGERPRAVDRLCDRCERPLVEVRNERGAYAGEGVFWIASLEGAPPGLGGAEPFDRVVALEAVGEPPWRGPTLWAPDAEGPDDEPLRAPPLDTPPPAFFRRPRSEAAAAVDAALDEPLRCLEPGLGPLARAAARSTHADRAAVLGRLLTRLGRMIRAARAGRADDGVETARQLASDHDEVARANVEDAAGAGDEDAATLEAERERLQTLLAGLEGEDPLLALLIERARTAEGGVALVVPGRAARDALAEAFAERLADGDDAHERLDAARAGAIAIVGLAEHRAERLDRAAYEGLRVIATVALPEATERVEEGEPAEIPAPAPPPEPPLDGDEVRWARWRARLRLEMPTAHPRARALITEALALSAAPWTLAHLRRPEGEALLVAGAGRGDEPGAATLEEARFHAELALLRVARRRLERALRRTRDRWRADADALEQRRRATERELVDARRRRSRALGEAARREAQGTIAKVEAALAQLDEEARSLAGAHDARRREALERFAARAHLEAADAASPDASHPRARVSR